MKMAGVNCDCDNELGFNPLPLVGAFLGAGGSGGATPAASAPAPAPAPGPITVSPAMQQAFNPQFSPVMQQSSGSGSQTANPAQYATGSQSAATRQPGPDGGMLPYGAPYSSPISPFADPFANKPTIQSPGEYTPLLLITGIVAVAALVGFSMYNKKSKNGRA